MRRRFLPLLAAAWLACPPLRAHAQTTINRPPPWLEGVEARAIETVPLVEIRAWARTLNFDFTPWNAPDGPLLVSGPRGLVVGPRARIAGRLDSSQGTRETLARGTIVGRIDSEAAVRQAGIARGINYVWVERTDASRWRALLIPEVAAPPELTGFHRSWNSTDLLVYELELAVYEAEICDPTDTPLGAFNSTVSRCFVMDCTIVCTGMPSGIIEFRGPPGDAGPELQWPVRGLLGGPPGPLGYGRPGWGLRPIR